MKLVYPNAIEWRQTDAVDHVAKCARVCYASETDKAEANIKLVESLKKRGHLSMFRHQSRYFVIKQSETGKDIYKSIYNKLREFKFCPFIAYAIDNNVIYISTNGQFYLDILNYPKGRNEYSLIELIANYEVTPDEFKHYDFGFSLMRFTFCLTTSIRVSRELNRVSPNNIAEQSTRYVNFDKKGGITICLPHWWLGSPWYIKLIFKTYWKMCEIAYKLAIKMGFAPEDASGVLPLHTATKVVYTYNVNEWKHIIDLRYHGTTGKPHPDAKRVMNLVRWCMLENGYEM